jgi:ATP-dependent Lhr-like helicase
LAGKRWEIVSIDYKKKEILVNPSLGAKVPKFYGSALPDIHPKIVEKMKRILLSNKTIPYLDNKAQKMLEMARSTAIDAKLASTDFIIDGEDVYWFTWTGTAKNRTLAKMGEILMGFEVDYTTNHDMAIKFTGTSIEEIINFYESLPENMPNIIDISQNIGDLVHEKYDQYVPDELLASSYAVKYLDNDIKGICEKLLENS